MKVIRLLSVAALAAAWSLPSSAAVLGMADLTINQLVLLDASGKALTASKIKVQAESRTGNVSSDFNGVAGPSANKTVTASGATLDLAASCSGPSCASIGATYGGSANNNLGTHLSQPAGNFALADMFIQGSAVNASGAAGLTRANVSVSQLGQGGANTTIANSAVASTTLSVTAPITARFALAYDVFVNAFVSAFVPQGAGDASATVSYSLTLREGATRILSFRPGQLNQGAYSNGTSTNAVLAQSGTVYSDFFTLKPGKSYSLTINQASNASATQRVRDIPEPGSMFLMALGLCGLAAIGRRTLAGLPATGT